MVGDQAQIVTPTKLGRIILKIQTNVPVERQLSTGTTLLQAMLFGLTFSKKNQAACSV